MGTRGQKSEVRGQKAERISGFTLIELLVVVGIITVLLVLLVPALDAAIASAERARCAGNLGSIGRGIGSYVMKRETGTHLVN